MLFISQLPSECDIKSKCGLSQPYQYSVPCMLVTLSPLDVPNEGSLAVGTVSLILMLDRGELVTDFSVEKRTSECQKDILQANICLSVCFPLSLSTQFLIWKAHRPPSSSRPRQRTRGFLCISALRSQAPQSPGPIVLLPVVVSQHLCVVS